MSAEDTSEVMLNGKLVKPLSELSVHEVGILLQAFDLDEFRKAFKNNKINGKYLFECSTVDEVKEMGISLTVKAKYFLKTIKSLQQLMKEDDGTEMDDLNAAVQMMPMVTTHKVELLT